jgi:hypothetical protein
MEPFQASDADIFRSAYELFMDILSKHTDWRICSKYTQEW